VRQVKVMSIYREDADEDKMRLRRGVVLTFPLAFALHDLEELLTAPVWSKHAVERIYPRSPVLARALRHVLPVSRTEMAIAVGAVSAGIAGVTAVSLRASDGDLRLLQIALAGYASHSAAHVGASLVFGGYTPGLVTVPLVVIPYSLWACSRLRQSSVAMTKREAVRSARTGLAFALTLALVGHRLARAAVAEDY
jgi:Protein of unknown function with HXXEE motif